MGKDFLLNGFCDCQLYYFENIGECGCQGDYCYENYQGCGQCVFGDQANDCLYFKWQVKCNQFGKDCVDIYIVNVFFVEFQ